jgi:thiamine-phosphate pyrophosphorylase
MLVSDRRRLAPRTLAAAGREAAEAGLDDLQIREKDLAGRALLALAREVQSAVAATSVRLLVNGRPDIAVAAGAHGVQLPEDGLPVAETRRAFPQLVVGASRHSVEGVRQAAAEGAHLVVLGPVFPTPGKGDRALGLDVCRQAVQAVSIPVYAIGGIDARVLPALAEAGLAGVALLRPFLSGSAAAVVGEMRAAGA